jgi:putative phage-type endonuclease
MLMKQFKIISNEELPQGSEAWLQFRQGKIGASMVPAIMGVSPWQTPLQLWESIIFNKSVSKTEAMQRGIDIEPKARSIASMVMGVDYQPVVIQSLENPDLIASLDGYAELDGRIFALEIKVPNFTTHKEACENRVPEHYYPQVQQIMDLMGIKEMMYLSYCPEQEDAAFVTVAHDESYCKKMRLKISAFKEALIDFKPPEPVDRDWVVIDDPEQNYAARTLNYLLHLQEGIVKEIDELKSELIKNAKHPRERFENFIKLQKITRRGSVDYEAIVDDYAINKKTLDFYRKKPIEYWRVETV